MQLRTLWLATAFVGLACAAQAQPFQGLYIGAGAELGLHGYIAAVLEGQPS